MNGKIATTIVIMAVLFTTSVSAIEVNPPILELDGESGDFVLQSIEIYNDRDQETVVNISIAGISNYYLPKSTYVLKPYERKTITIGFTISGSANGFITYEYNDEILTQIVSMNSEKNVIVFPQNPRAGTSLAIISTSDEKANGFLFVSETGRQYPVMLSGMPITFVNISKDDYGSAMIVLIWEDKEVTYNYINITKSKTEDEEELEENENLELKIDFGGSNSIDFGKTRIITLKYGDKPVVGSFIITKPSGDQILKDTNSLGQIQITFDEGGKWSFFANHKNHTASGVINVNKKEISFDIPDEATVGEEMEIEIGSEANYTILTPSFEKIDGKTLSGIITYTPDEGGIHTIIVDTGDGEGVETFRAYYEPKIIFKENGNVVNQLKAGKTYEVWVLNDEDYEPIEKVKEVTVYSSGGEPTSIPITNGFGFFTVKKSGYYTFSIDKDSRNYINAYSKYVMIYGRSSGGISSKSTIILSALIVAIIAVVYLYKKGKVDFSFLRRKPPALER